MIMLQDNRVVVAHRKDGGGDSAARNLRIFHSIPASEQTTALLYSYHLELAVAGQLELSRAIGQELLLRTDLRDCERRQIRANLGESEDITVLDTDTDTAKRDRMNTYSERCRALGIFPAPTEKTICPHPELNMTNPETQTLSPQTPAHADTSGKISLCMIVGNVEEYIQRCLQSFLPICDELCLVRAIGTQTPDGTVKMAEELAKLHGKPFRFQEYKNRYNPATLPMPTGVIDPENPATWPHVDNFAAARQLSFDLASHDYCFWCDSDDILKEGAEHIREHARRGDFVCYLFPYEIFGRGRCLPRERLVRKSTCKWIHRVHECLEFTPAPAKALRDDLVTVVHLPKPEKTGSHGRNLRILKSMPDEELKTGLLFHLNEELLLAGKVDEAVAVAQKILAQPDLGRPEKMELFINLATAAKDPLQVETLLHQAYQADPRRREPLAYLANHMLNWDHPDFALAYVRQMRSIPAPAIEDETWNHRRPHYGWLGEELYSQCLRACGKFAEGDAIQDAAIQAAGGARIALVHATRGRGKQAAIARKTWMDLAARPDQIEHLFVVDQDDPEAVMLRRFRHLAIPPGGGCVAAWNCGVMATTAPVIVQMSDDWTPPQKWDELILERLTDVTQPKVLAVSDGNRTDNLLCMAICTRAYLRPQGQTGDCFLFHPGFKSMYSDNWFTELAYSRGVVVEARDLVFQHHHPCFGTAAMDATYQQQNAPERYAEGKALLERLRAGTDWSSVPGYFDYYMFYDTIADGLKDGDVVAEVGVWLGRSIIYLAQRLKAQNKRVKLLAVDWFKGEVGIPEHKVVVDAHGGSIRAAFEANLERCGVRDMVEILEGPSDAMAARVPDGSLAFCYIDAAHYYDAVKADLQAWIPKMKRTASGDFAGTIAGHDSQWWEVVKAVKEELPNAQIMGAIWVAHGAPAK